jgi:hypothetical protein
MQNNNIYSTQSRTGGLSPFLLLPFFFFSACHYDEYVPIDYPDQLIYLPAAVNGIYVIDDLPEATLGGVTQGNPYRFTIEMESNEFTIPLGVYRSGIEAGGSIEVAISANTDTINTLLADSTLKDTRILPADKYSITSALTIPSGKETASFELLVDLAFLRDNAPQKYALGLHVSSKDRASNPQLNTVIVVIDTRLLIPAPEFSYDIDRRDIKKVVFQNKSKYGESYHWNFGDGVQSTEKTPTHSYAQAGIYTITLEVKGICGEVNTQSKSIEIL